MKALVGLLQSLFSADELRHFVALLPGENVTAALPSGSAPLATLAFEVVALLDRHGKLDGSFFELLENERPGRRGEIARVRALLVDSMKSPGRTAAPSTRGNAAAAASPLDPLAQKLEQALIRKRRLEDAGQPTDDIVAEICQLKREHRKGGQLRRGDALGERYLLAEQIGRGGFATVWRAQDGASGDDVAIKVLHPELAGDPTRRQRFFRGARIMAELAHPLVVSIREREAEDDGFFYFVMDFIPGGNLQDAVLEQRVKRQHTVSIILGIGQALAEAHRRGHVHRDVKPVNILLTASGAPRLTDFDLVTGKDTTGGTRTGALGTFIYAAPEMMERPQDADPRADVYGLGMTMAFMLHGDRLPRRALTARERFIEGLRSPPGLETVLKRATAEDLEDRYPDAAAFCDALRTAVSLATPPEKGGLQRVEIRDRHASNQPSRRRGHTAGVPPPIPSKATRPVSDRGWYEASPVALPPPDRVDWRIVIIVALLAMAMTTGALLAILQPSAMFSRERTAAPAPTSGTSAEHDAQAVEAPEPSESNSSAQRADSSCPDEVGCLLADKPPPCCSKYSGKTTRAGAPTMTPEKLSRSEITASVNKVRARVTACGSKGSGEVKVTVRVAAHSGLVDQVSLKSAPNAALGACVVDAMKHATFARGRETAMFTYPFVF